MDQRMRILADYHHSDLFESLQLLFVDRFGWELFAPYGMGWFDEGIWNFERVAHGDAVARQYLEGVWTAPGARDGYVESPDRTHPGRTLKGVTIEQARSQRWDVVICSLTHNETGFARFAASVGATYGIQVGNVGQVANVTREGVGWEQTKFALCSTTLFDYSGTPVPVPVPHVIYRQEFSLDDFRPAWPRDDATAVASFIQCFAENHAFYDDFLHFARGWPEFDWRVYGAYGSRPTDEFAAGNLSTTPSVAEAMRRTRTAWHAKWWSDGYGHVIHNLFATGTPIVGPLAYYADKLAGPLIVDGVTAFDIGGADDDEIIGILRRLRDDDEFYRGVSEAAAARFREVVTFDEDAEKVRALLESVL